MNMSITNCVIFIAIVNVHSVMQRLQRRVVETLERTVNARRGRMPHETQPANPSMG